jgi:plasmid stability protein
MPDLVIRDIDPDIERQLEERARRNGLTLSAEAKELIRRGLSVSVPEQGFGALLFAAVDELDRGDDLVFEIPGTIDPPHEFK